MSGPRVTWLSPGDPPDAFPPVERALREPDGLLAAGGDLSPARLIAAYRRGIFPWYEEGQPLLWWSPDPRCVFLPGAFHLSRRLQRDFRKSTAEVRINTAFAEVIRSCAAPRATQQGTWITPAMAAAYEALHASGWAHSIEIWEAGALTGGLYGIAIGRSFFGESMFSRRSNASKVTLLFLSGLLLDGTLGMLDCQVQSPHLMSLGATMIPRASFTAKLDTLCEPVRPFRFAVDTPIPVPALLPAPPAAS
jgi:leucyl/phenylalanyl-tRNA--protein transferase